MRRSVQLASTEVDLGAEVVERDLWDGAEARWCGPETARAGARLRPGDRLTVVDAGRHHLSSYSALTWPARVPRLPPRPGVVVRTTDGRQVRVPRRHLEHVAPDLPLRPEPDASNAAWWLDAVSPWPRGVPPVSWFVPPSFAAVVQVPHGDDGSWGELAHPTAVRLVDHLADRTTTPDDVCVAVWDGWGDVPPERFPGAARPTIDGRGYLLLRGPLTGVLTSVAIGGDGQADHGRATSGLWWPADRAWFVATEVDLAWTFVAGDDELADRLLADHRLGAVATSFDAPVNREPGRVDLPPGDPGP
jgi:hypothetical protein